MVACATASSPRSPRLAASTPRTSAGSSSPTTIVRSAIRSPGRWSWRGHDVATVADGVEALARVRRDGFDALVVDVMMPGVDGLAVCRVLRAEGDRVPVLMLTARVETPDRVAGLDAGADDYLAKPFELDELFARLRALLRRAAPAGADADDRDVLAVAALRVDPAARR